jgi:pimeloyl-ACP methyl ester carboxylesterase
VIVDVSARVAGAVTIGGVEVAYQVFGDHARAVLLLPPWSICHSAIWRYQVPRLTTRYTVVTFDGWGNGSSDRPLDPANYTDDVCAADALAVLDAVGIDEAAVVSASGATRVGLALAARHPDRVPAAIFIDPSLPIAPPIPEFAEAVGVFDEPRVTYEGWFKFNRHYWQQDWPGFLEFFMGRCFTEPDSSVQIREFVEMGLQTTAAVITATADAPGFGRDEILAFATSGTRPWLVIHGTADAVSPVERGQELARLSQAELVVLPGSGHQPQYRDPELVNRPMLEFLDRHYPAASR